MKKRILGFTLIELLIVITIIGILAVVFIPTVLNAPAKARDAQRRADIANIVKGVEAARLEGTQLSTLTAGCASTALSTLTKYFPSGKVPTDPAVTSTAPTDVGSCAAGNYTFEKYTTGDFKDGYGVFARLENANGNATACTAAVLAATAAPTLTATTGPCYGAISK